jgi:hypothetical protein
VRTAAGLGVSATDGSLAFGVEHAWLAVQKYCVIPYLDRENNPAFVIFADAGHFHLSVWCFEYSDISALHHVTNRKIFTEVDLAECRRSEPDEGAG